MMRRLLYLTLAALLISAAWAQSSVKLINSESGLLIGVNGGSKAPGAALITWPDDGTPSQRWSFVDVGGGWYKIVNVNSGLLIGVEGGSTKKGAHLIQWTDDGSLNQQWRVQKTGQLTNRGSGMTVGVWGASKKAGAQLVQWTSDGSPNQSWLLR
jgi:hypothetical protein